MSDIRKTLTLLKNINKYGIFALALGLRLTLSKVFGLCWVHRLCIIYIFLISFCVATLRHNIFNILGVDIKLIEGLLFGMGMLLIPLTLWKLKNKNY